MTSTNPSADKERRTQQQTKATIGPIHMTPVLAAIALTWMLAYVLNAFNLSLPRPVLTPFEELPDTISPQEALTNPAPYLNTAIFVAAMAVSGIILLYVARRSLRIRYFFLAMVAIVSFAVSILFLPLSILLVAILTDNPLTYYLASEYGLILGIIAASIVIYCIISRSEIAALIGLVYVGVGSGVLLGATVPLWTSLVLLIAASTFDIYAVFRGHLRLLADESRINLKGLIVAFRGMDLGLGDIVFYSMLITFSLSHFGFLSAIGASIGVGGGFATTLLLLRIRKVIPALPIPLLVGLTLTLALSMF
ncbi:MAG: hypothetical protein HYU39_06305 [Thaumarchaeota archaeon]|nr:hypothetical protein [Nitrososphaerota archaeon]